MKKLNSLKNFLISRNLVRYANLITKFSMEVTEAEIVEKIEEAKRRRDSAQLFDYSDLFEDGKDYVILPEEDEVENDGDKSEEIKEIVESAKYQYSLIGVDLDEEEYILDPSKITIFGEDFSLNSNLNVIGIKIYTNIVIPKIRSILRQNFPKLQDEVKSIPIDYLNSQDINTCFELKRDIVDSSLFLKSPSEFFNKINEKISDSNFLVDLEDLNEASTECLKKIENLCIIIRDIEELLNRISEIKRSGFSIDKSNFVDFDDLAESGYKVVISYNPTDIATATYNKEGGTDWTSCKNLLNNTDILDDVVEGGMVAYLVDTKDKPAYPIESPLARVRIRHFSPDSSYNKKDFLLRSESRVYGDVDNSKNIFLLENVNKWLEKANESIDNKHSTYSLVGDSYTDTLPNVSSPLSFGSSIKFEGDTFRAYDAKSIIESEDDLVRGTEDPSLALDMAISLTGFNYEEKAVELIVKEIERRMASKSTFYIDYSESENAESLSFRLLRNMLKSRAGRNLHFKSMRGDLSLEDIRDFAKSLKNFYSVMFFKGIASNVGFQNEAGEVIDQVIEGAFELFDDTTNGVKISDVLEKQSKAGVRGIDVSSIVYSEAKPIISKILTNFDVSDHNYISENVLLLTNLTIYNGDYAVHPDDEKGMLTKLSSMDSETFSRAGYRILDLFKEKIDMMFTSKEMQSKFSEEYRAQKEIELKKGNRYFSFNDYVGYITEDYDKIISTLLKIKSKNIESEDEEVIGKMISIAKRSAFNDGILDVETTDQAVEKLSILTKLPKEKILEDYTFLNFGNISGPDARRFFSALGYVGLNAPTGVRYHKKFLKDGIVSEYTIDSVSSRWSSSAVSRRYFEYMAKYYGLEDSNIKEGGWGRQIKYYLSLK